jgi:hypothetical protein
LPNDLLVNFEYVNFTSITISKVIAALITAFLGFVFIGAISLKIYAVQQLFSAKLDFIENVIDAKQNLISPNLEKLIEAKLGLKERNWSFAQY